MNPALNKPGGIRGSMASGLLTMAKENHECEIELSVLFSINSGVRRAAVSLAQTAISGVRP